MKPPATIGEPNRELESVVAVTRVSKYLTAAIIPNSSVFTLDLFVFALGDMASLALFQSCAFDAWAWSRGGRMKHDLRFSGSDVLETFPMPDFYKCEALTQLGKNFHEQRASIMADLGIGLTKLTNLIHSPKMKTAPIEELRKTRLDIDAAVLGLFGWSDIPLGHGFHEVDYRPANDRLRFTISETARVEVLRRLSELNRQRYEEEVEAGLHSDGSPRKAKSTSRRQYAPTKAAASTVQAGFDFGDSPSNSSYASSASASNQWGNKASDQILAWLEAHTGWFTKQAILTGCGAESRAWNDALAELLADDFVEAHADGHRWRAKP